MNTIARESLLFDCYGDLLTDRKKSVMQMYHEDNLSLSEVAQELGVSRAAVHDCLKAARKQLEQYEEKLGMVERIAEQDKARARIMDTIRDLEDGERDPAQVRKLRSLKEMIQEFERE